MDRIFQEEVKPLLVKKCFGCHGDEPKKLRGGLDMRTREAILRGGDSGPVLVPEKPEESLIYKAVTWKHEDLRMPPKERNRLSESEIRLLHQWIAAGAPWPSTTVADPEWGSTSGVLVKTSGGLSPDWDQRKYKPEDIWAFRPIRKVTPPDGDSHPLDAFVREKLAEKRIQPAPPAEKRVWLRRATYNLLGLPPTPEEVDAFLKDDSPQAYERVIDRLLKSPHYGEQMARHWLDVVRYADTAGFSNDYERPHAWRYRDYVIRSFNDDKPYDRFVTEQLAGDELEPDNKELLIAVGFLRMGPWEHTGMSVAAVTRQQYLDDITNSVGTVFLGQPLRCAQCHDHKFDPIPTRDYYRIQSVFAPVQFANRNVPFMNSENTKHLAELRERPQRLLKEAEAVLGRIRQKRRAALRAFLKEKGVRSLKDLPGDQHPPRHLGLTVEEMGLEKVYNKRADYYRREMRRSVPSTLSVYNGPPREVRSNQAVHAMPGSMQRRGKPQEIHILKGGSLEAPAEKVTPGILSAADADPTAEHVSNSMMGRRLAFARWLVNEKNPLTARVLVNRVWQQHFGTGLVATPNSFGKMGAKPTHPELLDWLAQWFMENNWSVKKLHRLIMTSKTYQQSGHHPKRQELDTIDPSNKLLAYHSPRRLAAEEIRDTLLSLAGSLNPERGGPGIFPDINWEVALQPRHIMGSVAPAYQPSQEPEQRDRRTIYAFRIRTLPNPKLEVLNRPGADNSCPRRDETTVVTQVFALFNGQTTHDRALALAQRIEKSRDRLSELYQLLYNREPEKTERKACMAHVEKMLAHHQKQPPKPVPVPTSVKREMVEELTGEPFEWTEELDLMKKYRATVKPWDAGPETRAWAELCLVLLSSNELMYVY